MVGLATAPTLAFADQPLAPAPETDRSATSVEGQALILLSPATLRKLSGGGIGDDGNYLPWGRNRPRAMAYLRWRRGVECCYRTTTCACRGRCGVSVDRLRTPGGPAPRHLNASFSRDWRGNSKGRDRHLAALVQHDQTRGRSAAGRRVIEFVARVDPERDEVGDVHTGLLLGSWR